MRTLAPNLVLPALLAVSAAIPWPHLAPSAPPGGGGAAAEPAARHARGPITFADVTRAARIADVGISFGASAGDFDGDGWVDLFSGGHYTGHPHLWHNQGDGTFADVTWVMQPPPLGDLHGGQWVDLDNDGSQELVLMLGANYGTSATPKLVYKALDWRLRDIAPNLGLDVPLLRGRTPLAVDYDDDGRIDLFLTALLRPDGQAPPGPMRQLANGTFTSAWPPGGFPPNWMSLFGVLGDLDGDQHCDLLLHGFPTRVLGYGANGLTNLTPSLRMPNVPTLNDAVIADFDGDGDNEVYLARDRTETSFTRRGEYRLDFLAIVDGDEHAVHFGADDEHELKFALGTASNWPLSSVRIGAQGLAPTSHRFALDPNDPANTGLFPHVPGQFSGICVGWDPTAQQWTIAVSSPIWAEALLTATTTTPMSPPTASGWNPNAPTPSDLLVRRSNGIYVDATAAAAIPSTLRGRSVVAADFDNDMDLDLFVVTSTTSGDTDDVLLENDGTGRFQPVASGPHSGTGRGIGDSVVTLDYDRDGRVDLFVVNGNSSAFDSTGGADAFGDDGPAQLLRNTTTNGNHWLQVEPIGRTCNRDAIGARIEVTTDGTVQVREHGGGMHRFAQNHGIHFGLGPHTTADVTVIWPDGSRTIRLGVPADQRVKVEQH